MYSILLVTHGDASRALLESMKLIATQKVDIYPFCVYQETKIEELTEKIVKTVDSIIAAGNEVICLTDITQGTPFKVILSLIRSKPLILISGVNLEVILHLNASCSLNANEAAKAAVEASKPAMYDLDILKELIANGNNNCQS